MQSQTRDSAKDVRHERNGQTHLQRKTMEMQGSEMQKHILCEQTLFKACKFFPLPLFPQCPVSHVFAFHCAPFTLLFYASMMDVFERRHDNRFSTVN